VSPQVAVKTVWAVHIGPTCPATPLVGLMPPGHTRNASANFIGVAVVIGLLSMGGPATLPGASVGLRVVLALMHVISGITITAGIVHFGERDATRAS
jgi:hypothetical protein